MKKSFATLIAALVVFALCCPVAAWALPMSARSIIYFDANDNIIGQQVLYCNNVSYHSGDISPGNPYRVEESFGCGDRTITCPEGAQNPSQCSHGSNNSSGIDYFKSATGRIASNYCNDPIYVGGPFFGHPGCGLPAPSQISALYPYSSGFGG